MIKDVKTILEKSGSFDKVTMGRRGNTIKLPDGRIVIPDVIARIEAFTPYFFEVECGNHNEEDFNDKCNKLVALTNKVIIIGKSRQLVTNILKPQVERFISIKGRRVLRMSGTQIFLFSMSDFSKGRFTYRYDMISDEPICGFGRKAKEVGSDEE